MRRAPIFSGFAIIISTLIFIYIISDLLSPEIPNTTLGNKISQNQSKDEKESISVFNVGDKVEADNVSVTLLNVSENSGTDYLAPPSGNIFIVCKFEIANNSDIDIDIFPPFLFDAYIDDYFASLDTAATLSTDDEQLAGKIASGKKMVGVLGYVAPSDWSNIEIRLHPNWSDGNEIIFSYNVEHG